MDFAARIIDALFGCHHSDFSFPITPRGHNRPAAAHKTGTYVACLHCGKEFPYDWDSMGVMV
jgi:hypothetical protein